MGFHLYHNLLNFKTQSFAVNTNCLVYTILTPISIKIDSNYISLMRKTLTSDARKCGRSFLIAYKVQSSTSLQTGESFYMIYKALIRLEVSCTMVPKTYFYTDSKIKLNWVSIDCSFWKIFTRQTHLNNICVLNSCYTTEEIR